MTKKEKDRKDKLVEIVSEGLVSTGPTLSSLNMMTPKIKAQKCCLDHSIPMVSVIVICYFHSKKKQFM